MQGLWRKVLAKGNPTASFSCCCGPEIKKQGVFGRCAAAVIVQDVVLQVVWLEGKRKIKLLLLLRRRRDHVRKKRKVQV